MGAHIASD